MARKKRAGAEARPCSFWFLGLLAMVVMGVGGCAPEATRITLKSPRYSDAIVQDFARSYIYREPEGDYHVLMVADASDEVPVERGRGDGPLEPLPEAVTQRIMHIHVFWRPLRGLKGDNPSATNAAIDFYIIGDRGDPSRLDVVKYEGTGFVDLTLTPDQAIGRIENATLEPKSIAGQMSDALGRCKVQGPIYPQRNAQKAQELLERIRAVSSL